jgi:hypothetical protein
MKMFMLNHYPERISFITNSAKELTRLINLSETCTHYLDPELLNRIV